MKLKNYSKTTLAFFSLLIHPLVLVSLYACVEIGVSLPRNAICDFISDLLAGYFLLIWLPYPIIATVISGLSVRFQILAWKNGESKVKNVILFLLTVLCEVVAIVLWFKFFERSMGV